MNILVIGGTYFAGRDFVESACKENKVTTLNRGTRSLNIDVVTEVHADRTNTDSLQNCGLTGVEFDAVVDFCAYNPGDIDKIIQYTGIKVKQYIFVSTCDVYPHNIRTLITEETEFDENNYAGPEGEYITGKVALEKELKNVSQKYDINVTSVRPAFIYGPNNYAGREFIYFQWILQAGQFLHPVDATGHFQFLYVKDLTKAIMLTLGNEKAYNKAFNICDNELIDYEKFGNLLINICDTSVTKGVNICDTSVTKVEIDLQTVFDRQIPLPFPLLKEESLTYDGSKIEKELGMKYTSLETGMKETFEWFKRVNDGH